MTYYFAKTVAGSFEDVVARAREALKQMGFGVITEIDMQATLRSKIGVEFRPYLILGACNPTMAHQALQIEDKIGTMLPCNVVIQALSNGMVEVAAIDPAASMAAVPNDALIRVAQRVGDELQAVVAAI